MGAQLGERVREPTWYKKGTVVQLLKDGYVKVQWDSGYSEVLHASVLLSIQNERGK